MHRNEGKKGDVFARLDAIEREEIPLNEIGSVNREALLFGISPERYKEWGIEWLLDRHQKISHDKTSMKIQEYYGNGARKKTLFARLDAIDGKKIPIIEIKAIEQEASLCDIARQTYRDWGIEWVALRHPEIAPAGRPQKLCEYYGYGARKVALFARLEAIDRGEVPIDEIGTRDQEMHALGLQALSFYNIGSEWVELRHPEVTEQDRKKFFQHYYGAGARQHFGGQMKKVDAKKALFARLDAVDKGEIPLEQLGAINEEANLFDISSPMYSSWGEEWVESRHPEVPTEKRRERFGEYYGLGARKKGFLAQLDAIDRGEDGSKKLRTKKKYLQDFKIGIQRLKIWVSEWASSRHPEIPEKQRFREFIARFARPDKGKVSAKRNKDDEYDESESTQTIFQRLDMIDRGEIPAREIGTMYEEAEALGVGYTRYKTLGMEWVAERHPEVPAEDRVKKFSEYYGTGAKKKALFARLDAIDRGEVQLAEVGFKNEEETPIGIGDGAFDNWSQEWLADRHPEIAKEDCLIKITEYYGVGAHKKALFNRLNAIANGDVPPEDVGTLSDKFNELHLLEDTYISWGTDWVAMRYPSIPVGDRTNKLLEFHVPKDLKDALFARLDSIVKGEIPIQQIGSQKREAKTVGIGPLLYNKWGIEWVADRYPDLPPQSRRKKLREFYGRGYRHIIVCKLGREQLNSKNNGGSVQSIMQIAHISDISVAAARMWIWTDYKQKFLKELVDLQSALFAAEKAYSNTFPMDTRKFIGQCNHTILKAGIWDVMDAQKTRNQTSNIPFPKISLEKYEDGVFHDALIENVHSGNWFNEYMGALYGGGMMWFNHFRISPEDLRRYSRISIDFTIWEEPKNLIAKAIKYANEHTLLFIALTSTNKSVMQMLPNHPNVRVIRADELFRFLGASTPAIENCRKVCNLTRKASLHELNAWAARVKKETAASFLEGQKDLHEWLRDTRQRDRPRVTRNRPKTGDSSDRCTTGRDDRGRQRHRVQGLPPRPAGIGE